MTNITEFPILILTTLINMAFVFMTIISNTLFTVGIALICMTIAICASTVRMLMYAI